MTVYLSFGHDYMLHYATISKTTPEFLQISVLWSIVDSCLYLTLCDCSPSCFDPDLFLLACL